MRAATILHNMAAPPSAQLLPDPSPFIKDVYARHCRDLIVGCACVLPPDLAKMVAAYCVSATPIAHLTHITSGTNIAAERNGVSVSCQAYEGGLHWSPIDVYVRRPDSRRRADRSSFSVYHGSAYGVRLIPRFGRRSLSHWIARDLQHCRFRFATHGEIMAIARWLAIDICAAYVAASHVV